MNPSARCNDQVIETITLAMEGSNAQAMDLIHEALATTPGDHRLWFLRACVYASEGQRQEARVDLIQTMALAPDFHIARFLHGLLEMMEGRSQSAASVWEPLDGLPASDALRLFKSGLLALGNDQFEQARTSLTLGLAAEHTHPSLVPYIQAMLGQIDTQRAEDETSHASEGTRASPGSHLFLASYRSDSAQP